MQSRTYDRTGRVREKATRREAIRSASQIHRNETRRSGRHLRYGHEAIVSGLLNWPSPARILTVRCSIEMRHDVTTLPFRLRKKIDNLLYKLGGTQPETVGSLGPRFREAVYPSGQIKGWMPLYTMVTFRPDIGYAAAKTKAEGQARILNALGIGAGIFGVVAGCTLAYHRFRGER